MFTCLSALRGSSLLPAHSLSSPALSSSTYTPTLAPLSPRCGLLPAGVLNSCRYTTVAAGNSGLRLLVKKNSGKCSPALCRGLCSNRAIARECCMHKHFRFQLVFGEPVRRWTEMATLLVRWCVSVWGKRRGVFCSSN